MNRPETSQQQEDLLTWRVEFLLGRPDMDDTHQEFVELLNAAYSATKDEFKDRFHALVMHTRRHFDAENELMKASNFFAINEHIGEHHRVMGQLDYFNKHVHLGRHDMGRQLLRELPAWFELHARTMDSALAGHLKSTGC